MTNEQTSIGRNAAIALYESRWWEERTPREIATIQLFTVELCCPFQVFLAAMQESLGRPIWTHEFASSNFPNVVAEFLGERPAPTMEEIIELIPERLRIIITP